MSPVERVVRWRPARRRVAGRMSGGKGAARAARVLSGGCGAERLRAGGGLGCGWGRRCAGEGARARHRAANRWPPRRPVLRARTPPILLYTGLTLLHRTRHKSTQPSPPTTQQGWTPEIASAQQDRT
ncbi:unnamed protein product, partial [Iphiclides podalirius]